MKGKWCQYVSKPLFCREEHCKECPVKVIGTDGYIKQIPVTCDMLGTEGVKCKRVL